DARGTISRLMGLFGAISREVTYIRSITRSLAGLRSVTPDSAHTIVDEVEARARHLPDNIAFHYLDRTMSYRELDRAANRVARWARGQGIGHGDAVALLMENRPEYVATWLGLLKVGA